MLQFGKQRRDKSHPSLSYFLPIYFKGSCERVSPSGVQYPFIRSKQNHSQTSQTRRTWNRRQHQKLLHRFCSTKENKRWQMKCLVWKSKLPAGDSDRVLVCREFIRTYKLNFQQPRSPTQNWLTSFSSPKKSQFVCLFVFYRCRCCRPPGWSPSAGERACGWPRCARTAGSPTGLRLRRWRPRRSAGGPRGRSAAYTCEDRVEVVRLV